MPEARRHECQFERSVTEVGENCMHTADDRSQGRVHVMSIFQDLTALYTSLTECLENDTEGPTNPRTVLRVLQEQKKLLVRMEHAIETAVSAGVSREQIAVLVDRIDELHQRCQHLMQQQAQDMQKTIAVLQQRENNCTTYQHQRRTAFG